MDLADPWTRSVLLAAAPACNGGVNGGSGPALLQSGRQGRPWPLGAALLGGRGGTGGGLAAVPQLLVKGLFYPPTQLATIQERGRCLAGRGKE